MWRRRKKGLRSGDSFQMWDRSRNLRKNNLRKEEEINMV